MSDDPIHVLLVEDDEIDVEIFHRAFRQQQINYPIVHAIDGIEALQMLRGKHNDPGLVQPYLIFLDINLPRMNGIEFLHTLRQHLWREAAYQEISYVTKIYIRVEQNYSTLMSCQRRGAEWGGDCKCSAQFGCPNRPHAVGPVCYPGPSGDSRPHLLL